MSVQAVPRLSQVPVNAVSPERFRALVHLAQYMELIERMLRLDGQQSG